MAAALPPSGEVRFDAPALEFGEGYLRIVIPANWGGISLGEASATLSLLGTGVSWQQTFGGGNTSYLNLELCTRFDENKLTAFLFFSLAVLIGFLLGAVFGPIGAIIGAVIGAIGGITADVAASKYGQGVVSDRFGKLRLSQLVIGPADDNDCRACQAPMDQSIEGVYPSSRDGENYTGPCHPRVVP